MKGCLRELNAGHAYQALGALRALGARSMFCGAWGVTSGWRVHRLASVKLKRRGRSDITSPRYHPCQLYRGHSKACCSTILLHPPWLLWVELALPLRCRQLLADVSSLGDRRRSTCTCPGTCRPWRRPIISKCRLSQCRSRHTATPIPCARHMYMCRLLSGTSCAVLPCTTTVLSTQLACFLCNIFPYHALDTCVPRAQVAGRNLLNQLLGGYTCACDATCVIS